MGVVTDVWCPAPRNEELLSAESCPGQWTVVSQGRVSCSGDRKRRPETVTCREHCVSHYTRGWLTPHLHTRTLLKWEHLCLYSLLCFVPCPVNPTFMVSSLKMQYNCRPQAEMSESDKQEHCRCCSYTLRCLHLISQRRCNRCRPGLRNTASIISVTWLLLAPDSAS